MVVTEKICAAAPETMKTIKVPYPNTFMVHSILCMWNRILNRAGLSWNEEPLSLLMGDF